MFRRHIIRETQRFLKGKNLSIQWLLFESNGEIHNLEGKELEVYMVSGGHRFPVKVYTVTENAIAWTFLAGMQTKPGYYKLVLYERDPLNGLYSYDVHEAFMLVTEEEAEHFDNVISEDAVLKVTSVLTYAHVSNLASVDTVEADGGKVAVVHLTNGKTFNIPVGGGGGGSSFTLLPATATKLGGIRIGFTQDGNKYPVKLDGQNKAYVEVPENGGVNVHNGLYSTSDKDALSANMGRVLREMIENIPTGGGGEGGGTARSKYALYLDESGPEVVRRQGSNIVLYRFKPNAAFWDRLPVTGDFAMVFDGSGYVGCYELIVSEDEEEGLVVVSNSTLRHFALFVADIDGAGGGSTPGDPGDPGRSITGVQHWFKLCADESVQATPMDVADPSSAAGGSWSLIAGSPTVQYPYLRCFMQVNYDQPLESGYTYTRSSAFTARYFNSDSSVEYEELVDAISSLRSDLLAEVSNREAAIAALNTALEGLRSTLSGSIANQLTELRNRLNQINGTDVELIMNDGLWAVLTSWASETGNKKAFADIILQAENAKAQLQTGSTFFDRTVGGNITLDGILGQIAAKVTRQDVNAMIASAQFSVDPSSLNSVISKSQACWRKNGILYPYDLYLTDYMSDHSSATLADYETYMTSAPVDDGPSGDSTRPAGPFELVVVVEQFSAIKQTMDEISASVDTTKYMWQKGNQYASYNAFETQYENRSSSYSAYTYEQYVTNVLGYTRVEVGAALSNITQTSDEIKAQIGDMGYFWRKPASGGGYEYQRYAVPSNTTRDAYVASMQSAGWSLVTYASRMSVIDQFPDSITALVKNSTLCWIDSTATGDAYCRDYDYWKSEYEGSGSQLTYEEYIALNHSDYVLTVVTDAFSRIKQTADSVSSAVAEIEGHETRLSAVEQTADEISIAVSKSQNCWKDNLDGTLKQYEHFRAQYNIYSSVVRPPATPLPYEDWVVNTQNHTLSDSFTEVSGIKVQSDKVWAGVGDGDDVKASIEILGNADVDEETGSKIILDADNVIINGGLSAGVVKAGAIDAKAVTTEKLDTGAVTAGKIDAGAVTAEKIAAGAVTAAKIDAGAITADKIASGAITADKIAAGILEAAFARILQQLTVGEYGNIVLEDGLIKFYDSNEHLRMQLGQGENDDTPVLKFFDTDGETELYDLGPNGITQMDSAFAAPRYNAVRFWRFSTNLSINDKVKMATSGNYGQGTIYSDGDMFLFHYLDGMRVTWLTASQSVIQYRNPDTGQYSSSPSKYNGMYFSNADFTYSIPDGYYIIAPELWTPGVTLGANAVALRIVTQNNVKKYYYGTIDLRIYDFDADIWSVYALNVNTLFE